jgi:hypothetical protein
MTNIMHLFPVISFSLSLPFSLSLSLTHTHTHTHNTLTKEQNTISLQTEDSLLNVTPTCKKF